MSRLKVLSAALVASAAMSGATVNSQAAPLPTHIAAMKAIAGSEMLQVRWGWGGGWRGGWGYRGFGYRGWGHRPLGWGAAAAGAVVGGALVGGAYYGSYPYYGGSYAYGGCDPYAAYGYGGYSQAEYGYPQEYGW